MTPKKQVRLSPHITPIEYDIQLKPDLDNFTFEGMETISLNVLKKTKVLTLHSKELEIETADIIQNKQKIFAKISYNEKAETVTFTFKEPISVGVEKLNIAFKGILNDKMRGFYKSSYMLEDKEHHIATTQFEATDARRAFPCFDEPAQKSVFHVSLIVPNGKTAISNTLPVSVSEHEAGFQIVKFSPTPKMSTYLLAFIVGNFEYVEKKSKKGKVLRVYTTPGKKEQASFALSCAVKTLEFYEEYFDIAYPLPGLDMIAIPDFASGAMENWGAITYRESALLVDKNNSSLSNKQWVALVIAHEIAHQWFGNLVTMEWWTHLWLNEGFASYIEYLAVDKLFPTWDIWTQFANNDLGVALRLDALQNTHPIEILVHHPDEIGEIFDEVSYSKGASIIRMLANYLGEEKFRDGLRYYLKKHSYKNTETFHLWQAFEKVSLGHSRKGEAKKPVGKIMQNWTGKSGYPVIRTEIVKDKIILTQERFFASPISKMKNKESTLWQIPINIEVNKNFSQLLLKEKRAIINFPKTWIKINQGETSLFRVAYTRELLERLREPVEKKILKAEDRLGIIRDLFALSEAGTIPTTDALKFLRSYKNEDNYTVWVELASGLSRLEQLLAKTKERVALNDLILELFSPLAKSLGWEKKESELHTNTLLRSLAVSRAGRSGDKEIVKQARKMFSIMTRPNVPFGTGGEQKPARLNSPRQNDKVGLGSGGGQQVNPDTRGAVYSIVASHGKEEEYKIFIKKYEEETLHEEKNRLGSALGDFNDPELLKETCKFALSKHVRTQDTIGILSSVGSNPLGRDIWWNFVSSNWNTLVSRYGEGGHQLARLVKAISGSAEEKHLNNFKTFFKTHEAPGAQRAIEQVLERLEGNIAWLKRDLVHIKKFLNKK